MQVSYYEIYKEKIYDLLASTTARTKPRVRTIAHTFLPLCVCVCVCVCVCLSQWCVCSAVACERASSDGSLCRRPLNVSKISLCTSENEAFCVCVCVCVCVYMYRYVASSYKDIEVEKEKITDLLLIPLVYHTQHWISLGNRLRATAATGMNDRSSRSHSVFTIMLTQTSVGYNSLSLLPPSLSLSCSLTDIQLYMYTHTLSLGGGGGGAQ